MGKKEEFSAAAQPSTPLREPKKFLPEPATVQAVEKSPSVRDLIKTLEKTSPSSPPCRILSSESRKLKIDESCEFSPLSERQPQGEASCGKANKWFDIACSSTVGRNAAGEDKGCEEIKLSLSPSQYDDVEIKEKASLSFPSRQNSGFSERVFKSSIANLNRRAVSKVSDVSSTIERQQEVAEFDPLPPPPGLNERKCHRTGVMEEKSHIDAITKKKDESSMHGGVRALPRPPSLTPRKRIAWSTCHESLKDNHADYFTDTSEFVGKTERCISDDVHEEDVAMSSDINVDTKHKLLIRGLQEHLNQRNPILLLGNEVGANVARGPPSPVSQEEEQSSVSMSNLKLKCLKEEEKIIEERNVACEPVNFGQQTEKVERGDTRSVECIMTNGGALHKGGKSLQGPQKTCHDGYGKNSHFVSLDSAKDMEDSFHVIPCSVLPVSPPDAVTCLKKSTGCFRPLPFFGYVGSHLKSDQEPSATEADKTPNHRKEPKTKQRSSQFSNILMAFRDYVNSNKTAFMSRCFSLITCLGQLVVKARSKLEHSWAHCRNSVCQTCENCLTLGRILVRLVVTMERGLILSLGSIVATMVASLYPTSPRCNVGLACMGFCLNSSKVCFPFAFAYFGVLLVVPH